MFRPLRFLLGGLLMQRPVLLLDAFDPPPKVESAVVRMRPQMQAVAEGFDAGQFAAVVGAAFGQRRKTLRNSLSKLPGAETDPKTGLKGEKEAGALLEGLGIDPGLRAENLAVADYIRLATAFKSGR